MDWDSSYGLFTGKSCFIFPEYSNRVFLGTNTIPMHNICPKLRGFNQDIHQVFCEEDSLEENHWIYENQNLMESTLRKLITFLDQHDGVHVQLVNKEEILDGVEVSQ